MKRFISNLKGFLRLRNLDIVNDAQGQHELRVLKGSQKAQPSVVAKTVG